MVFMKKDSRELAISFTIHSANTKSNAAVDTKTALVKNQARRLISYVALSYLISIKTITELRIGTLLAENALNNEALFSYKSTRKL